MKILFALLTLASLTSCQTADFANLKLSGGISPEGKLLIHLGAELGNPLQNSSQKQPSVSK